MPRDFTDGLPTTELEKTLQVINGVHFYAVRAKILCQVHSICDGEYNVTTKHLVRHIHFISHLIMVASCTG
jgi:hypothetical protein